MLYLITVAVLPASLEASRPVRQPDGTEIDVPTPYAIVPASARPVAGSVSYGDVSDDIAIDTDPDGLVYFVTVSEPSQSLLGSWVAHDNPAIEFLTHDQKYGSATPSQRRTLSLLMMRTSSQVAQYVALRRAGFDARLVNGPVQVQQLFCLEAAGSECTEFVPAAVELQPGDIITDVDGTPTPTIDELQAALVGKSAGDTVTIAIERVDVDPLTVDVELTANPNEPDVPLIGFQPFDTRSVDLPFEVDIDTGLIGGPSAGLAFTLTLIDELTPGNLLGGRNVAVTGEIDVDGNVGAIGGLPQKAETVRQAGVDVFLVPASQSDASLTAARLVAGDDVEIITVATLDDALAELERLGGDPLPTS
ncbi:hypothetical protein BH24ACT5_BH24ACT5_22620 [soil metagenome]